MYHLLKTIILKHKEPYNLAKEYKKYKEMKDMKKLRKVRFIKK